MSANRLIGYNKLSRVSVIKNGSRISKATKDEVCDLIDQYNLIHTDVANHLGVSQTAVSNWFCNYVENKEDAQEESTVIGGFDFRWDENVDEIREHYKSIHAKQSAE